MTQIVHKSFSLATKASGPTAPGSVGSWYISSTDYDRVNDRIAEGALKSHVGKDLLCLWQHDSHQPVGKWTNLQMIGKKLAADLVVAKTELGAMIKELLDVGTPLGASIGFTGGGKANEKGGIDFSDIEILETSVVSVPCNPQAMQIAKSFGVDLPANVQEDPEGNVAPTDSLRVIRRAKTAIWRANKALEL